MAQTCKGICELKKTLTMHNNLRYKQGQKRCVLCNCYFLTENILCPCCKTRLRRKPRNKSLWNQM